jgi:hypothetical protein
MPIFVPLDIAESTSHGPDLDDSNDDSRKSQDRTNRADDNGNRVRV